MVRRIVTALSLLAACVAAVVFSAASGGTSTGKTYYAEFDNAFGLVEGGDLRIGGVKAGQTPTFSISNSEPPKAVAELQITEPGFDSLREDARCEVRQQSLIGEYYVDCQPGTSDKELEAGATIPVTQTASIVPADLVNNVLREPYKERLRLIIAELGTGLAGRPEDLSETLRRAHPGLSQTIQTLDILKNQTRVLKDFVADSDVVIEDLTENRQDVVRFVREAGETAAISATRKEELEAQFQKLPVFLAELEPTMVRLGQLADAQMPLLADLRSASDELNAFFAELGPFSQASLPAIRSLGETSVVGRRAIDESEEEIRELRQVAASAGGVGEPLRQFLQTTDSRARAIATDRRASNTDPPRFDRESLRNPRNRNLNARGFTGYEALMNFAFWQTLTINGFDGVSHFLRILGVADEQADGSGCTPYATAEPERNHLERCNAYLGPTQPGVENAVGRIPGTPDYREPPKNLGGFDPDPTERGGGASAATAAARTERRKPEAEAESAGAAAKGEETDTGSTGPQGSLPPEVDRLLDQTQQRLSRPRDGANDAVREGRERLERLTGPRQRKQRQQQRSDGGAGGATEDRLLDFLLGP